MDNLKNLFYSVRQNIRDGHPDFSVTADSWPAFLYPDASGDVTDVEKDMFKSAILIKASFSEELYIILLIIYT